MSIQALREQRAAKAKSLHELANKADYVPAVDNSVFDALSDEIGALDDRISRMDAANKLHVENTLGNDVAEAVERDGRNKGKPLSETQKTFNKWLREGDKGLTAGEWNTIRADLGVGTTTAGGFTVQTDVATSMLDALKFFGGMREVSTILRTEGGNPLGFAASDGTAEVGAIVAENVAATDLDPAFTLISVPVYKYTSLVVPVSWELLQDSAVDIQAFVSKRLTDRLGRIQNAHFTTGTGTAQPRGVATAATVGKTGLTGQTLTAIFDDLVDLEMSVDRAYRGRPDAAFMMSDTALRQVRKIKDTAGLPIFGRGTSSGEPGTVDMLFGKYPVIANNDVAVMAANAKSILFGAFKEYVVRDVMGLELRRWDDSAYAKKGQVGFCAWIRSGGNLIDNGGAVKAYQNSAT
jgi:HK97 family phage major capsid protein